MGSTFRDGLVYLSFIPLAVWSEHVQVWQYQDRVLAAVGVSFGLEKGTHVCSTILFGKQSVVWLAKGVFNTTRLLLSVPCNYNCVLKRKLGR